MKLSIITICYNDKQGLQLTLESVKAQTTHDFQYIVIDGASKDGSADLLTSYAPFIDYSVSEPDSGIYNAMNKGIAKSEGEYCLFMNAGDTIFANDTIERAMPLLDGTDFLSGNTICVFPDGKTKVWKAVNDASTYLMSMYSLSHQATFIKTDMLKKRPYREDLKVVSDWEQMFYELIIGDKTYKRLNLNICKFAQGGVSSTQAETRERERKIVLNEHFSKKMQTDIAHPNLLVRIASLADYGSPYYGRLELVARIVRKIFGKN